MCMKNSFTVCCQKYYIIYVYFLIKIPNESLNGPEPVGLLHPQSDNAVRLKGVGGEGDGKKKVEQCLAV